MSDSKIEAWPRPRGEEEIRGLLERARGGDATELAALRKALDRHPEIWRAYGDLAALARDAWIDLIAGVDLVLKECLGRRVEEMKTELAGPAPSPLEMLLVERIAACWLQVWYADAAATQTGEISIQQGNYIRKRQDSAHRRYLMALGTLATTRRLLGLAEGTAGVMAKALVSSTDPASVVGADSASHKPGERGAGELEDDTAEDGLVLEFGPPRGVAVGGEKPGRRQKSKVSPRS